MDFVWYWRVRVRNCDSQITLFPSASSLATWSVMHKHVSGKLDLSPIGRSVLLCER
jgi:hypothetical protein